MWQETAFIAGKDITAPGEVGVEDPSTGQVFATTPDCGPDEVDRAVAAARQAADAWRRTAVADRAAVLRRLAALIDRDRGDLGGLESRQTGKPLAQGLRDAELTARYFDFYASAVETFYGTTFPLDERTTRVHGLGAARSHRARHPVELPAADPRPVRRAGAGGR